MHTFLVLTNAVEKQIRMLCRLENVKSGALY